MSAEPETETAFAVILDEDESPPRIYLVHNNADPIVDGKEGKPEGIGLPGGGREAYKRFKVFITVPEGPTFIGYESRGDKTSRHAARREVSREVGFIAILASWGKGSRYGEILREEKLWINNTVYTFLMRRVNGKKIKIEEPDETGRDMRATLGNILMMPLAVNKARALYNSQGIYYKHRERLVRALEMLGYDFFRLVPNLSELICRIKRDEVGDYVHDILCGVLQAAGYNVTINGNFAVVSKPSWQRPTDEELETGHRDYALQRVAREDEEERRRWANG